MALLKSKNRQEKIASLNIKEQVNKFKFKLPTGTLRTLVTFGQYDTQDQASNVKQRLESKHDLNLIIVKFPTPEPEPAKTDEEVVDAVIEALQASKQ